MKVVESFLRIMLVTFVFIVWFAMIFFPLRPVFAAEPLRLEAQVGQCQYGLAPDGIWWTDLYPTNIDRRTTCYQLGVSQAPWHYKGFDLGWRLAYVNLGKLTADNQFTYLEPQHPGVSGEDCDAKTLEGCRGRGKISQKTRGFTFGPLIERSWRDFTLGVEAGGYYYRSVFEVNINSVPDPNSLEPIHAKWASWRMTGYYGATARYGYLFATGRIYSNIRATEEYCQECGGITGGKTWQAIVGVQILF